jgi:iron complex outermembrane recepter protein
VNLFTQTGYTAPSLTAFPQGGAHGFGKGQLATGGRRGSTDWYASAAHIQLDGYRDWSDQRRDRVNLHAGRVLGRSDFRAFYFFAHVQEHLPGSLTRAEFDANPSAASAANVANQWGRDYDLHHAGVAAARADHADAADRDQPVPPVSRHRPRDLRGVQPAEPRLGR